MASTNRPSSTQRADQGSTGTGGTTAPEKGTQGGSALPPAPETGTPSTEEGPRTVFVTDDTAVIVDSPGAGGSDGQGRQACVVKDTTHVGAAVPGTLVCSYHTMHYNPDGTRRGSDRPDQSGLKGGK